MLMRLLLLVGLIGLAYFLIKRFLIPTKPAKKNPESFQSMVRCDHCGLHVPQPEAIARRDNTGDKFYCSDEHAKLGQDQ